MNSKCIVTNKNYTTIDLTIISSNDNIDAYINIDNANKLSCVLNF